MASMSFRYEERKSWRKLRLRERCIRFTSAAIVATLHLQLDCSTATPSSPPKALIATTEAGTLLTWSSTNIRGAKLGQLSQYARRHG